MSLILTGTKTAYIAGTVMQCIEVYTGESYTFPFNFTTSVGDPVDITGWTFSATVKYYTMDVSYATQDSPVDINISNLILIDPQPTPPTITTGVVSASNGTGWVYIPAAITPSGYTPTLNDTTTLLAIVKLQISRTDSVSSQTDVNYEPIGMIIRYL